MTTGTMSRPRDARRPAIHTLITAIQHAIDTAAADRLPHAVGDALRLHAHEPGLLAPQYQLGNDAHYTRHILYAHPAGVFTMVALVWRPGQVTPVHGHYTWCAYTVLAGALHEECFEWRQDIQRAVPVHDHVRRPGDTASSHAGLDAVHRIRNGGTDTAISIHVYGVDAGRVSTHVNRLAEPA